MKEAYHMDRIDIIAAQHRIAILSDKRDEIFYSLKKEIPVDEKSFPNVYEAYMKLYDAFISVIREEAKCLGAQASEMELMK